MAYFGQYLIYLIAIGTATLRMAWLIAWIAMQAIYACTTARHSSCRLVCSYVGRVFGMAEMVSQAQLRKPEAVIQIHVLPSSRRRL